MMIFVDTGPLVALSEPRDQYHERAMREVDRMAKFQLVLCEPNLTEAAFLLPRAIQRARLFRIVAELPMRPWWPEDPDGFRLAVMKWLARYAEHDPDWADGYLAVASQHVKRMRVWTYDDEFRTIWRKPSGQRIPLALT